MLSNILYTFNLYLSKLYILHYFNLIIFSIPSYLPAIFLVSTIRQLISLFFFSKALSSTNKYLKYFFFTISFVSHFTGVINIAILLFLHVKKNILFPILISSVLIFYLNSDLFTTFFNKIEHYSDDSEAFLSFSKILITIFIGLISLTRLFYKQQIVDKFILFYIALILFFSYAIPSISLRLFNSIYFIFIIYILNFTFDFFQKYKRKSFKYEF